jgi:hypothetical protein
MWLIRISAFRLSGSSENGQMVFVETYIGSIKSFGRFACHCYRRMFRMNLNVRKRWVAIWEDLSLVF